MNDIRRVLGQAAWRLWAIRALRLLTITLSGAVVALMGVLLAQRIFGLAIQWPGDWFRLAAAALGAALLVAGVWSLLTRPRGLHVARELDERADLRESLSTALCVADSKDPWAAAVVQTARERAAGVKVGQAIPITGPRFWPVPLALALSLVILVYTVPRIDVLGLFARRQQAQQQHREIQRVAAELKKDEEKLDELLRKAKLDLQNEDSAEEGADRPDPQNPDQARRIAIKKLTSLREKLAEERGGEKAQQLEALKQQLRQLKQPGPGPLENLSRSLQKGNFDQAQKDLEELQKQLSSDSLSQDDRAKAEEQLKKLAEQLEKIAEDRRDLEKKLEQAGMDPQKAREAAKDPKALAEALEQLKNLTPEQKEALLNQAKAQNEACRNCGGMGEAMSQMAKGLSEQGMSQEAQEAMEQLAGQLSDAEMLAGDIEAMDAAMQECKGQLEKLGGQCQGDGECFAEGEGMGSWKAGDSANKGKGSGGPGQGYHGSPDEIDSPVVIEKKMAQSKQTQGPIIGTRLVYGDQVRGESRAEFTAAVESSAKAATEAIDGMLVPRELHPAVKGYFGRLESKARPRDAKPTDHAEPAK